MSRGPTTELDLYEITRTSDGMGGFTETETKVKTISGYFRTLSGREKLTAGKETVIRTHRFYCDYDSAVTEDKFFKDSSGNKYDIETLNNVGNMNIKLQIDLKRRT